MKCAAKIIGPAMWALLCHLTLAVGFGQSDSDLQAEREVRDMERQWREAWLTANTAALDRIHADDFTSVPNIGIVSTKAEVMADVRQGVFRYSRMEQSEMTVRIYNTTAVIVGRTINEGHRGDRDVSGDFRYTRIYVKRDGRWQAVLAQYTRIARRPEDVVVRYIKQVIDGRNLSILEEIFQPDCVLHRPEGDLNRIADVRAFFENSQKTYSEIHTEIKDIIASGDRVVVRLSHQGIGRGAFKSRLGMYDVKGKAYGWEAIAIFQIKDGKIAEQWVNRDELGILLSIGAVQKKTE